MNSAPSATWKMFDRIAFRYDLLNHLLSFRRDVAWRKFLCRHLPEGEQLRVLDLATGTGDVLISLHKESQRIGRGVGLDMSANMLTIGFEKLRKRGLDGSLTMLRSDAGAISIRDDAFDAATMAFGIRNVPHVPTVLRDIRRVLRPGGRALILEFSLPARRWIRAPYLFYFRNVLPRVGALISGDGQAYRYLNQSVEDFPYGEAFVDLMLDAGYRNVEAFPLTLGIATLYRGDK